MAYSFQTFTFEQVLTSTEMNQVEVNVRDHVHGRSSVAKTGVSFPVTDKTGAFTAVAGDVGEMFNCDGTFTVTLTAAATLGTGWSIGITNDGSGTITIDPDGSETIDGGTTLVIGAGQSKIVYCTGTEFFTIGSGGGLVPLLQASASASATVDFESDIDSTYEAYLFVLNNVRPATDDVDLWLRVGTGGTPTYQSGGVYDYINTFIQMSVAATEEKLGGDTKLLLTSNENSAKIGNDADGGFNGLVWMFNPAGTAQRTMFRHQSSWWPGSTGADVVVCEGGGLYDATTAVTAIRFLASSGNITSGEFRMYGIKSS